MTALALILAGSAFVFSLCQDAALRRVRRENAELSARVAELRADHDGLVVHLGLQHDGYAAFNRQADITPEEAARQARDLLDQIDVVLSDVPTRGVEPRLKLVSSNPSPELSA